LAAFRTTTHAAGGQMRQVVFAGQATH
jgi:hypothetical protein